MNKITRKLLVLSVALIFAVAVNAHDQIPGTKQNHPILLRGGDLFTVSDGVKPVTDILFENGRITAIGTNLNVPANTETIDVTGKRVYPGLIGPYSNVGLIEIGAARATDDINEVGNVKPEAAAHIAYSTESELIPTIRSNGVTTMQIVPGGGLIPGRSFITNLDGWTKEDAGIKLIDGLCVNWPGVSISSAWWETRSADDQRKEMAESRRRLRQVFADARSYSLAKKANPGLKVDLRWDAMAPIFSGEMPVYIVADDYRQILEAINFATEQGIRMVLVGGKESWKATDLLKEKNIPVILGTTTSMPLRQDDDYDSPFTIPKLLQVAGVKYCLGHFATWDTRNLAFQGGQAVAYGLKPDHALRALTLSTAEILGIDKDQGSLDVGKKATIIVSDGEIMDVLGNKVTLMFIEGRAIDLDNKHKELFRKYQQKHYVPPSK